MEEEQLDYGEDEYGDGGRSIPDVAEEEEMEQQEDDCDNLYNDVNVGQGFPQAMQQHAEPAFRELNGGLPDKKFDGPTHLCVPGVEVEGNGSKSGRGAPESEGFEGDSGDYRGGVPHASSGESDAVQESKFAGGPSLLPSDPGSDGAKSRPPMPMANGNQPMMGDSSRLEVGPVDDNGPTVLFVGELQWWTTDAELESVLSQYGRVKEIKFFDERASGKSKGYCQVELYDAAAAAACEVGMDGHEFNGRPCVVAYASPQALQQMGAAYMNNNQAQNKSQLQGRRQMNDGIGRGGGMNNEGGNGGRNFRRGGWEGRGGQGFPNRDQGGAWPMRGRGGVGSKGIGRRGATGSLMHPQGLMGAGFDPAYLGRGAPFGGFSGPAFLGMVPPFQAVSTIGFPGVAPNVMPALLGCGMPATGMGIIGSYGMEGISTGMWTDTTMGGWKGEDHDSKTRESSYGGGDFNSDYGYREVSHGRGGRSNIPRDRERDSEHDWSKNSNRGCLYEREEEWDRSDKESYREENYGYREHKQRYQDYNNEDHWDRRNSSASSQSNLRMGQDDDHGFGRREVNFGKRRRMPSE